MKASILDSPIGPLTLVASDEGLTTIGFPGTVWDSEWLADPLADASAQLTAYFAGELEVFDLALAPAGTAFQRQVWDALGGVPYGHTTTYGAIAERIGRPTASRAVGAANGRNPLPIVVPCHRIIGSSGALTGYAGGLAIKRHLLSLERAPGFPGLAWRSPSPATAVPL